MSSHELNLLHTPQQTNCIIKALGTGIVSCNSLYNFTCTCADAPYQAWLTSCVSTNCTVPEGLVAERISKRSCDVPVPPHQSEAFAVTQCLFFIIMCISITVRIIFKGLGYGGGWGINDSCILPAFVCFCGYFFAVCLLLLAFPQVPTLPLLTLTVLTKESNRHRPLRLSACRARVSTASILNPIGLATNL